MTCTQLGKEMKILVTGFEPWGKWPSNPAGDVAILLGGERIGGVEIVSALLPVEFGEDTAITLPLIEEHKPAAVVSLGLAQTSCLNVERVAVNLKNDDQAIYGTGPDAYFATLPTRAMKEAIEKVGIPSKLSYHAGTFLCNHIMFGVLHFLAVNQSDTIAGFIHVPPTPDLVAAEGKDEPSMSLEMIREGTVIGLGHLVDYLSNS